MQSKGFLAVIGVLIVGAIGLIIFANRTGDDGGSNQDVENLSQVQADDHVIGNPEASVVLIEYADLECPACAAYQPMLDQLYAEYGDQVAFVYRHFPLTNIHPRAIIAARAAEAAGQQDSFHEMVSMMFMMQSAWSAQGSPNANPEEIFEGFAAQLGLDIEQYRQDFANNEHLSFINRQRDTGGAFNVSGTPTFILNGERIDSPATIEEFQQILDEKLNQNETS